MKAIFLACLALLALSVVGARADNVTVTIATNPPQGGIVTGAGTFPAGTTADVNAQASNGWYIADVRMNGSQTVSFIIAQDSIQNGDLTQVTNDQEGIILNSDAAYVFSFLPLRPIFGQTLSNAAATTGSQVTLQGGAGGRQPIRYQWQKGNQSLTNATNATLTLSNVQPSDSGAYSVTATNGFGTTNETANLVVRDVLVFVNGQAVTNGLTNLGTATVSLQSRFAPNDLLFYTLDGSTPTASGTLYTGPFQVSSSATIRAIAYTNSFLQTAFSDTIPLTIIPTYTLSAFSLSGGTVTLNPPGGVYTNGTVVTLTVSPNLGWTFMGWIGAPLTAALTNTYVVTGNVTLTPLFGTTISTIPVGNGTISTVPNSPPFVSDSVVYLMAIPNPGSYFVSWGGAAAPSGMQNPGFLGINTNSPTATALFASVPSGKAALTILVDGDGYVYPDTAGNLFSLGATNSLTAFPDPAQGQEFLGWSGDASGTNNPLPITFTKDLVITAHFTKSSTLSFMQSQGARGVKLTGAYRTVFRLDASSNLSTWTPLVYLTNAAGPPYEQIYFDLTTNAPTRFYRAVGQ